MKTYRLTPMIWTEDLQDTIDFYTTFLGFTCGDRNDDWGWAGLFNDTVELMISKPQPQIPFEKLMFTGSLYFYVEDVEALWEELHDKVKVAYPIETFEWQMREFAIYDNNGYILQFGEDLLVTP